MSRPTVELINLTISTCADGPNIENSKNEKVTICNYNKPFVKHGSATNILNNLPTETYYYSWKGCCKIAGLFWDSITVAILHSLGCLTVNLNKKQDKDCTNQPREVRKG